MSNNNENMSVLSNSIFSILFDKEVVLPYVHKEVPITQSALNKYLGVYKFKENADTIRLVTKEGKLFRSKTNRKDIELKAESDTKFFYVDSDNQFEFTTDASGQLSIWFIQNGLKKEMVKLQ